MKHLLFILMLTLSACCSFYYNQAAKCGLKSDTIYKVKTDTLIFGGDTANFHYYHDTTIVKNRIEIVYRDKYFNVKCPSDTFIQKDSTIILKETVVKKQKKSVFDKYLNKLMLLLLLIIVVLMFIRR